MLAITTFPPKAWSLYAGSCVRHMVRCWPGSIRVYFEGSAPPAIDECDRVELRPLDMPERDDFLRREIPQRSGFLWDAKRVCHKVFAQLDAAKDKQPFWWIDADVVVFDEVPESLVQQEAMVTFLGRDTYTETGLVGFNAAHPEFSDFESKYLAMYSQGRLLELPCWTDCHAFDAAREGRGLNLTPLGKGFDNVIEQSEFGRYMAHFKGPLKRELYRMGGADAFSANL